MRRPEAERQLLSQQAASTPPKGTARLQSGPMPSVLPYQTKTNQILPPYKSINVCSITSWEWDSSPTPPPPPVRTNPAWIPQRPLCDYGTFVTSQTHLTSASQQVPVTGDHKLPATIQVHLNWVPITAIMGDYRRLVATLQLASQWVSDIDSHKSVLPNATEHWYHTHDQLPVFSDYGTIVAGRHLQL